MDSGLRKRSNTHINMMLVVVIRYNREQIKEKRSFQERKRKYFAAILGVWKAIANKMEVSQEIYFFLWGKSNPGLSRLSHAFLYTY